MKKGKAVVETMMKNDLFSQWLGLKVLSVVEGSCRLSLIVRSEMTNGFNIAHGGITYSLADSALAFASNSFGQQSVSFDTSIAHFKKVEKGDELFAEAKLVKQSNKLGWYEIGITNQKEELVASFKGTVYRTKKIWE